mmetsp:Transcript_35251/g.101388  ORF Transcript_35251/g.101388 Transcript_35251/m.101388 type:complete len:710 (-) Transcript_35251:114-2243(-)
MGQNAAPQRGCKDGCLSSPGVCMSGGATGELTGAEICDLSNPDTLGYTHAHAKDKELLTAAAAEAMLENSTKGGLSAKWRQLSISVDCSSSGKPLGIKFDTSAQALLRVASINPDSSLEAASRVNPESAIAAGDFLVEVAGQRGPPNILQRELEALTKVEWEYICGSSYVHEAGANDEAPQSIRKGMEEKGSSVIAPAAVVEKEASVGKLKGPQAVSNGAEEGPSSSSARIGAGAAGSTTPAPGTPSTTVAPRVDSPNLDINKKEGNRGNFLGRCKVISNNLFGFPPLPQTPPGVPEGAAGSLTCPILLHFDVNKTIITSDTVSAKNSEDGVREAVADIYWGFYTPASSGATAATSPGTLAPPAEAGEKATWRWTGTPPHLKPPDVQLEPGIQLTTYFKYCKKNAGSDKDFFKTSTRTFQLVTDPVALAEMEGTVARAMQCLNLPAEMLAIPECAENLKAVGLSGSMYFMVPTLFYLTARLQRQGRQFAVLFRSFGKDHLKIQGEWNAFCEMRHPIFSRLIEDIGPMDGSVSHLPDRRVKTLHTLYRDSEGPVLILDTFTNGPEDKTWDSWAKSKPKPKEDTRQGRTFISEVLKAKTVEGLDSLQIWMDSHLTAQSTSAIKDDWAWWQFHGETALAGKLLPLIGGARQTQQIFFDDNIDLDDARIVDCRAPTGESVPSEISLGQGICVKVNPVEALLENDYFYNRIGFH